MYVCYYLSMFDAMRHCSQSCSVSHQLSQFVGSCGSRTDRAGAALTAGAHSPTPAAKTPVTISSPTSWLQYFTVYVCHHRHEDHHFTNNVVLSTAFSNLIAQI
jgi:hypothetical protein